MSAIETDLLKPELVFFDFEATDRIDFFTNRDMLRLNK